MSLLCSGFIGRTFSLMVFFTCLSIASTCVLAQDEEKPEKEWEDFNPNNFSNPTKVDNPYFPLNPGMRLTWEGSTIEDDGEEIPHKVVFTVTDLIKVIAGVRTVVCWDQDYADGALEETEIVFFAQDDEGTVWHLGQYPEEYDDGKLVAAPAWLHGIEDAVAGIMMKAEPKVGTPGYSQGWGPAVGWTDRGVTYKVGEKAETPYKNFDDVLVIKEWAKEEPGAYQIKYYGRGVGNIKVGWEGDSDPNKETLALVKVEHLEGKKLAKVRKSVLKLEKSAYKNSKNVYAHTTPAEQRK